MAHPVRRAWGDDPEEWPRPLAWDLLQQNLARLVSDPFGWLNGPAGWRSRLEVREDRDGWVVEAQLPGVAPEEVEIEVMERELVIRARHAEESGDEPGGEPERPAEGERRSYVAPGFRSRSDFGYRLTLPAATDLDRIDATMDHGLLTVRLPRSSGAQGRRVPVGRPGRQAEPDEQAEPGE